MARLNPTFNRKRLLPLLLLILLVASVVPLFLSAEDSRPANWAKKIDSPAIQNFFQVDDNLYRCAQPDQAAFLELEKRGVRTVLNLRGFHSDLDEARGTKLKLIHVPIDTWNITDSEVVSALRVLADKANYPVVVHCQHGADRTGIVVAMYRTVFQGWSKEGALKELTAGGFGFHTVWANIPKYINGVDIEKVKAAVFDTKQ